jgi:hypothetical protein
MVDAMEIEGTRGVWTLDAFEALSDRCLDDSRRLASVVLREVKLGNEPGNR